MDKLLQVFANVDSKIFESADVKNKLNEVFWRNPYKNQEMKDKGYSKIYDCGQLVFVWNKI